MKTIHTFISKRMFRYWAIFCPAPVFPVHLPVPPRKRCRRWWMAANRSSRTREGAWKMSKVVSSDDSYCQDSHRRQ